MFFVNIGKVIAWGLIIVGAFRGAMGYHVAYNFVEPAAYAAATARYLGSSTSGEAINQGMMAFALGVAFGLLAHIASNSSKASTEE